MRRDPFIFELIRIHGAEGYMAYNITLDVLAENEVFEKPYITSWGYMAKETCISEDALKKIYEFISGAPWGKFEIKEYETHIEIFCPNLIKYADEYCKKRYNMAGKNQTKSQECRDNVGTNSGECRDNVGATIQYNTIHNKTKDNTKTPSSTGKTPVDRVDYTAIMGLWNNTPFTTKIRDVNDKRKQSIRTRLKEPGFNLAEILTVAGECEFLRGSKWFTFDWIFKNGANWRKVIEGNYRDKKSATLVCDVPNAERLYNYFCKNYEIIKTEPYISMDKPADVSKFAALLKEIGTDNDKKIAAKIRAFFKSDDKFVIDGGYTLPIFFSKINSLNGGE